MNSVFTDAAISDDKRRELLYQGQLFVYNACPASLEFCEFARGMIREAFGSLDPETAQYQMEVEKYAAVLAELKPKFIHHPKSKHYIPEILRQLGCDLEQTYFDVPRMRSSTSDDYLTSGIAYAFHAHRDTWYSAPMCQINFWIPIFQIVPANGMAFHPRYWSHGVKNGSHDYNYEEWNRTSRQTAAQHIKTDTRKQPKAEEPMELDPQVRVIPPPGGIIIFSGAQMHSSVPNDSGKTRFSIDFRTVHLGDTRAHRGAPNVDSHCTGTTMRDYLHGTDLSHLPEDVIEAYDTPPHAVSGVSSGAPTSGAPVR
ncbi:MAG: hypothetical protein WCA98_11695 [Candidatus Acidiferrales bacterium]